MAQRHEIAGLFQPDQHRAHGIRRGDRINRAGANGNDKTARRVLAAAAPKRYLGLPVTHLRGVDRCKAIDHHLVARSRIWPRPFPAFVQGKRTREGPRTTRRLDFQPGAVRRGLQAGWEDDRHLDLRRIGGKRIKHGQFGGGVGGNGGAG